MINDLHLETHSFFGFRPGPNVLILGRVHGNEYSGTLATKAIIDAVRSGKYPLVSGSVTFIPITNPLAANRDTRNGDRNLNRAFYQKLTEPQSFEDGLNNVLCPIIEKHDIVLDLHSFLNGKEPFALIGEKPSVEKKISIKNNSIIISEEELVSVLDVSTVVTNWSTTYVSGVKRRRLRDNVRTKPFSLNYDEKYGDGTTEYARSKGALAITLECGQHIDPLAQFVGENSILSLLKFLGIIENYKQRNDTSKQEFIKLFDVIDKHDESDYFREQWSTFSEVKKGQIIGYRKNGQKIYSPTDCVLIFPNAKAEVGQEWIYLGKSC